MNKEKLVKCGCGGEPELEPRYIKMMYMCYTLRCPCCGIEIRRKTKTKAIEAWNRAMGEQIAKVDSLILTSIPPQTIYKCRNCWNEVKIQDNYCSKCGVKLEWSNYNE